MKNVNVGIDLGTTYSAVAVFDAASGQVEILNNDLGEATTPSVVCIENGRTTIGQIAKDAQASGATDVAAFYKSMMGNPDFTPYLDGKTYSAEELSGIFLTHLKAAVEKANGLNIVGAVITVPAYFNEAQRQATIRAGERAGFKVLKIINEPTAAIIAYGLTGGAPKTVMVYDLGGGTFDVTIAKIDGSRVNVIATNGNHELGGKNWDSVLVDELCDRFNDEFGIDIKTHREEYNELVVKCEKAKKLLTELASTTVAVQCEGFYGKYPLTRESFEERTRGYMNETLLLTQQCFAEIGGGFGWKSIDEVVLVGGSTRMPQVAKTIEKEFGKPPRIIGNQVDTIVAAGAAMQAHLCVAGTLTLTARPLGPANFRQGGGAAPSAPVTLTLSNDSIRDVTSHSLGMLAFAKDGKSIVNSIIIKKNSNTGVPFGRPYNFRGDRLEVYVLQGESTSPYDCTVLYKYIVTGMKKGEANKFTINFLYNQNGVVEVTGNLDSGAALKVQKSEVTENISEIIARLMKEKEEAEKNARADITFGIDTSGSMTGEPLEEAKQSIVAFAQELAGSGATISVCSFSDDCNWVCRNAKDAAQVKREVARLDTEGGTSADPIDFFLRQQYRSGENQILIVLTDGEWFHQDVAIRNADNAKGKGVKIYAVGVGDADYDFLRRIASKDGARKIDIKQLVSTFREIADVIATETGETYSSLG